MRWIGIERVHPVEHGRGVREFSRTGVERALATADASKVEPNGRATQTVKHVKEIVDQRIVHRAAELGMWVQNHRHRCARVLLALVSNFDPARRAGEDDVRH